MRSGYEFTTEELARKKGEEFVANANTTFTHYPNPKIEVVPIQDEKHIQ